MKLFLFLYPIQPYLEYLISGLFEIFENPMSRFNELITKRYRDRDYQVGWVVFSDQQDASMPDKKIVCQKITVDKDDLWIPSGVSFAVHTTERVYPRPSFMHNRLPANIEEIKLAGFHQFDCVNKVGEYLYKKGFDVLVDEDLTDHYFDRIRNEEKIPDVRIFTAEEFGVLATPDDNSILRDEIVKFRLSHPWFAQPSGL